MELKKESGSELVDLVIKVGLIFLLGVWTFEIVRPFLGILIWSIIISVAGYPIYVRLFTATGERGRFAAGLFVILMFIVVLVPAAILGGALVDNVKSVAEGISSGEIKLGPPPESIRNWPIVGEPISEFWVFASNNFIAALAKLKPQLLLMRDVLLAIVRDSGLAFLQLIIAILITGVSMTKADKVLSLTNTLFLRLSASHGPSYVALIIATIRNVGRGVVGIAFVQAVLSGIGMTVMGVPMPGLIALLVFILSVVRIGPGIVLVPVIIYAFFKFDVLPAVLFAVWTTPVMLLDNVLGPILMGRGLAVPTLVIFVGVLGGTLFHGLIGLFIGPVVLAIAYQVTMAWIAAGKS